MDTCLLKYLPVPNAGSFPVYYSKKRVFVATDKICKRIGGYQTKNFCSMDPSDGCLNKIKFSRHCCSNSGRIEPEEYISSMNASEIQIPWNKLFSGFIKPFAVIGAVLSNMSSALLAIESLSDISLHFIIEVVKVAVIFGCLVAYADGINKIFDIEIDKINKPYVLLASGEMNITTAAALTSFFAIMSFTMAFIIGSWPLVWGCYIYFLVFSAYSINLPFLRWRKQTITAALSILVNVGIVLPTTAFLHIQTFVLGRQASITNRLILQVIIASVFAIALALFKDVSDVEGDVRNGVVSLAASLGSNKVFWICVYLVQTAFICATVAAATYSQSWRRPITIFSQIVLALIFQKKAKTIDLKNEDSVMSFFLLIWKLLYAEFFILPFMR